MNSTPNFFFLLISPPDEVIEYVAYLKQLVAKKIGHSFESIHSLAHLTLLQYYDFHNESLLYTFKDRISKIRSFSIQLKGFGRFKESGTIYLAPFAPDLYDLGWQVTGRPFAPHITIAKNLKPHDSHLVWKMLEGFKYSNFFVCEEVKVLKRVHDRWQSHLDLPLS